MKKVLVTGANGQLGKSIQSICGTFLDLNFRFKNSIELDITNVKQLQEEFQKEEFDWCINCAAYTAVDKAEQEEDKAYKVNVLGVRNVANVCKDFSVKLIHISTDFVFDGEKQTPYSETDLPNPRTVYGQTKLQGEVEVQQIIKEYFIIRTSWLYSKYGNNFVKTILRLAKSRDELSVVNDQIGTPTSAIDLAEVIVKLIEVDKSNYGLYHFSNEGETSWYGLAQGIFKLSNLACQAKPILTKEYPTLANRPAYSVLDKNKIIKELNISIPNWIDSLDRLLISVGENNIGL